MKVRLGIDLGGTFIKAGIVSEHYKVLYNFKVPSGAESGNQVVIYNLKRICNDLLMICNNEGYKVLSIGIGSPGTISQPNGKVTDASPNIKNWQGTILTKVFSDYNIPVYADNDANSVALAEYLIGYKCRYKDMVFVTIGTGIGGGLIIDGSLYRGSSYTAAEIGHIVIKHNGRLCGCGRRGCLEAYASVPNMMKRFRYWSKKHGGKALQKVSPAEMYGLFKKGDKAAKYTIEENADYLGAGLGSLVNVLNPQAIVIGGGFADAGREYISLIQEAIKRNAFKAAVSNLKVLKARLSNNAGFIGASLLSFVDDNGKIIAK
ncbi:MAG: ROK family protein [candidate division Zixibacteria bacterium]|nr:ROK family protein [candidate division Zixibacteria bacterium]